MPIIEDAHKAWLILTIIISVIWLVIGWRAMRAHEKLADSVEWIARQNYRKNYDSKEQESVSSIED